MLTSFTRTMIMEKALGELKAAKEEASKTPMNNSLDKGHKEKGGNVI